MANNTVPSWLEPFITADAYVALKAQIEQIDPQSREEALLKYIALRVFDTLTIKVNGTEVGNYDGDTPTEIDLDIPIITYGSGVPTGGSNGDVYLRYA